MDNPPVEYVGGKPEKAPSRPARWVFGAAIAVLVLVTAFLFAAELFRQPLAELAAQAGISVPGVSTGEPEITRKFVRATELGDGVSMRLYITPHCLADPNSGLCFGADNDANWARVVKNSHPKFAFQGVAGDLVVYHVSDDQGDSVDVTFRMDAKTGLIDSQRVI